MLKKTDVTAGGVTVPFAEQAIEGVQKLRVCTNSLTKEQLLGQLLVQHPEKKFVAINSVAATVQKKEKGLREILRYRIIASWGAVGKSFVFKEIIVEL